MKNKKYTNCDEVYKSLQKFFASKTYEAGERVPSERDIAEKLDVNRTTLRTALQRMVGDGLLERQIGVGTFFKISPKELAENYKKINMKCSQIDLLEARIMLEPKLAHLAALNISGNDIKALKNICNIDNELNNMEILDIEFHDLLADISRNSILKQMYSVVSEIRKKLSSANNTKHYTYECAEIWTEHQHNILSALEKKNPKAAYEAVREKLNCILGEYSDLKN